MIDKDGQAVVEWKIIPSELSSSGKTVNVPEQIRKLIYNGNQQSPSFMYYYPDYMMIIGGMPSKVNVGEYFATFSLKPDVVWADGTTENKTVPWYIIPKTLTCPYIKTSEASGGMYYYEIEGKRYPVWVNYTPETMTISGDLYDIDNSWHTTEFTLKNPHNYDWACVDGDTYSVMWKLSEAYIPDIEPGTGDVRVHIPQQIKAEYEDGTTKYPKWDRYDNTAIMSLGGIWEEVDFGTYYVILMIRDGYIWEDDTVEIKAVPWRILAKGETQPEEPKSLIIKIPEQINIPYYDGYVKQPEWDVWDKYGIDIVSGDLYGVLAGGYPLVLRPQTGYVWEDGTTEEKEVVWYINPGEVIIPDDVPKNPLPEVEEEMGNDSCCGCGCCCDTGLFDKLNNTEFDYGDDCDCSKEVDM